MIDCVDLRSRVMAELERLNSALVSEGDLARIRYVSIEPDFDFDDKWIFVVTWEIPDQAEEDWSVDELDEYWGRTRDSIGEVGTAHCLFRTPKELSEPVHQRGEELLTPA